MRRGACPTLAEPMQTGDGWLARLSVAELSAAQLAGLAMAAGRLGNGILEVTGRGSLQVRGLAEGAGPALAAALADLDIAPDAGLPVVTGALAGVDPAALADPRPVAAALRAAAAGLRLLPKVTAVVDGGGALTLDAVPADLRLLAVPGGWMLVVGDHPAGVFDAVQAVAAARERLATMAAQGTRGTALAPAGVPIPMRPARPPVGRLPGCVGIGLPFGQAEAVAMSGLAEAAPATRFRPAAGRALVALDGDPTRLLAVAGRAGFIVSGDDPRLGIVACPGAPACGSGRIPTRALAGEVARLAGDRLGPGWRLHLSGCAKRCAQPRGCAVTVVGTTEGWEMTGEGMAVPQDLRALVAGVIMGGGMS